MKYSGLREVMRVPSFDSYRDYKTFRGGEAKGNAGLEELNNTSKIPKRNFNLIKSDIEKLRHIISCSFKVIDINSHSRHVIFSINRE